MNKNPNKGNVNTHGNKPGNAIPDYLQQQPSVHSEHISRVTVVLPLHNEAENVKAVCTEIVDVLSAASFTPKILLVDDGSQDNTFRIIVDLAESDPRISYISFSRNFGKEAAIMAGLDEAGDDFQLLAYMDSDGQHDPLDLVKMIRTAITTNADLVCGARMDRDYQSSGQRWMTKQFYKLFHLLTNQSIEEGVGDFNVLRPKVVRALRTTQEDHLFMKGLIAWVGFQREIVPIKIRPRAGGVAKSSTTKMAKLAVGAFLSFSSWPLRTWSVVGIFSAFLSIVYLLIVVLNTILHGREVPGYATTIVLLLGIGGLQLFSIGILGEYVARIYDASKQRPRYIISKKSKT